MFRIIITISFIFLIVFQNPKILHIFQFSMNNILKEEKRIKNNIFCVLFYIETKTKFVKRLFINFF